MLQHGFTAAGFRQFLPKNFRSATRIAIAVSGGVDSIALVLLLQQQIESSKVSIYTFTVDHRLRTDSTTEAYNVQKLLRSRGLHHEVLEISPLPNGANVEQHARIARYGALTTACLKYNIRDLYLAHHADDQVETVMLRMTHGSTWSGLRGMTSLAYNPVSGHMPYASSIFLHRPLLGVSKSRLIEVCHHESVPWFEDHTNNDVQLTPRNAIREILRQADNLPRALHPQSLLDMASQLGGRYKSLQRRQADIARKCRIVLCEVTGSIRFLVGPLQEIANDLLLFETFLQSIAMITSPMVDARRSQKNVLLKVFRQFLRDSLPKSTSACGLSWTLQDGQCTVSRQQYDRSEFVTANVISVSDRGKAQYACFDRRFFIRAHGRPCDILIRPIRKTDMRPLRERAKVRALENELDDALKLAHGTTRFTLPLAVDKLTGAILALPSAGLVFDQRIKFECDLVGVPFKERLLAGTIEDHYYDATHEG